MLAFIQKSHCPFLPSSNIFFYRADMASLKMCTEKQLGSDFLFKCLDWSLLAALKSSSGNKL
jgi:hypothetical protein